MNVLNKTDVFNWTERVYNLLRSKDCKGLILLGDTLKSVSEWHGKYDKSNLPARTLKIRQYPFFGDYLV